MYLRELKLQNIKCFANVRLSFPPPGHSGNWCVILGDNGTGKSSILRAIALALMTSSMAARLVENPKDWARKGYSYGTCSARFQLADPDLSQLRPASVTYAIGDVPEALQTPFEGPGVFYKTRLSGQARTPIEESYLFAGYGPFRRLQAGEGEFTSPTRRNLDEALRTLFDPRAGLHDLAEWLQRLDYLSKDEEAVSAADREHHREHLAMIKEMINSLLPEDAGFRLAEVNSGGVFFTDPDGTHVSLGEMSDGYRTMFAVAVDLLKRIHWVKKPLNEVYRRDSETNRVYADLSGIVLIDEADAHLHPRWQREIGFYLQRAFPRVQFIVATHSPFVAQAATPGGIFTLRWDPEEDEVRVDTSIHSLRGLPAEHILLSGAFDLDSTRDSETADMLEEHGHLAAKKATGALTADETERLTYLDEQLKDRLPGYDRTYHSLSKALDLIREAKTPDD